MGLTINPPNPRDSRHRIDNLKGCEGGCVKDTVLLTRRYQSVVDENKTPSTPYEKICHKTTKQTKHYGRRLKSRLKDQRSN